VIAADNMTTQQKIEKILIKYGVRSLDPSRLKKDLQTMITKRETQVVNRFKAVGDAYRH
jgi:hypothetical protein